MRADIVPGGVFPDYELTDGTKARRKIRPDWDLAGPGLRANWDAGDHAQHYPYRDSNATIRSA